jgi:hypothetical protein
MSDWSRDVAPEPHRHWPSPWTWRPTPNPRWLGGVADWSQDVAPEPHREDHGLYVDRVRPASSILWRNTPS